MTGLMREMTGLEKLRELAEAIKQGEDRKAIARVREKGGVNALSMGFQDADNRRVELCAALDIDLDMGWSDAMAAMRRRLMPEGMEWPCFEDGEPVRFGDVVSDGYETGRVYYVTFDTVNPVIIGFTDETPDQDPGTWLEVSVNDGERVKRPERKDSRPDGCCHPGSYECDELAFRDQNSGEDVYADKCLVPELRRLRESGIRTLGSCCGHGTTRPNIIVAPECEGAMRRQGYEGRRNKFGVLEFAAKSSCPAPKVLDADGVEIRVGDRLYDTDTGCGRTVRAVNDNGTVEFEGYENRGWFVRFLTHRAPVLAADGKPLREGEQVYHVETGAELVVKELPKPGGYQAVVVFAPPASHLTSFDPDQLTHEHPVLDADGVPIKKGDTVYVAPFDDPLTVRGFAADGRVLMDYHSDDSFGYSPENLTHTKPEPDSWERIEEDKGLNPFDYCKKVGHKLWTFDNAEEFKASDLVRRAKKLAGVE